MNHVLKNSLVIFSTAVAAYLASADRASAAIPTGNLLTDESFEPGPASLHPYFRSAGIDPPWMAGQWNAEAADLISGVTAGITPHSPNRMLRVNQTGGVVSQVSQIIDKGSPTTSAMTASFFAWVNSNAIVNTGIQVHAGGTQSIVGTVDPVSATVTVPFVTDDDPTSWQMISGTLALPIGTQFLDFELFASNATIPSDGVFFDTACLSCVPEPHLFALLVCGVLSTAGLPVFVRRRGATCGHLRETPIS